MKYTTITTLAAMLLGTAGAFAQGDPATAYTTPSGFVTHTLKAGQFNLVGLTLHSPIAIAGAFETVSGTTLTDTGVDFTTVLTAGKTYILEITENTADPSLVGTIQEITSWTATTLTTPQDLAVDGLAGETTGGANDGAKYQLREATTLTDILGVTNTAGLQSSVNADPTEADVVFIPKTGGGFNRYFYSTLSGFVGWLNAESFAVENPVLVYTDGVIIQRRAATNLNLVITGSVKKVATTLALTESFNYLGSIFPVGSTLDSSNLSQSLQSSANADPTEADVVFIPNGAGGYDRYFFSTLSGFAGWLDATTFAAAGDVDISAGVIIQNRSGVAKNAKLTPPSSYSNL